MAERYQPAPDVEALVLLGATRLVKKGANSPLQIRTVLRKGLPFSALGRLQEQLELTPKELGRVLGIPERTWARRKLEQQLTPAESDRLYRIARTVAHAEAVLGSLAKARNWLTRPNRALGGETPLTMLDTDLGTRQVEDVLFRLEYGVHS